MNLAKREDFASDILRFTPSDLLATMRWPRNQQSYARLQKSIKRLKALTITYENCWYDRKKRAVESCLMTGILAEAELVFRRWRRAANAVPPSYVQWTATFFQSLQNGNLVDLDLYFSIKRPAAADLMRHLNKVWHAGRRPRPYSRDLKEIACGHLGMVDSKFTKRNFQEAVKELEEKEYITRVDNSVRYKNIARGVWRVTFELHPNQMRPGVRRSRGEGSGVDSSANKNAEGLVALYHQHRFRRGSYVPQAKEVIRAKELIASHPIELLCRLTPQVARAVAQTYGGEDLYFGAAVPHFARAIDEHARRMDRRTRKTIEEVIRQVRGAASAQEEQDRRQERLAKWQALSMERQRHFRQSAIDHAKSTGVRRRLRRWNDLNKPPSDVLNEMDATIGRTA